VLSPLLKTQKVNLPSVQVLIQDIYKGRGYLIVFAIPVFNKFVWYILQVILLCVNRDLLLVHETLSVHMCIPSSKSD
jgi:hypothetical protein